MADVEQERAWARQLMAELLKATANTMEVHQRLAARFELMANDTQAARAARKVRRIAANIVKLPELLRREADSPLKAPRRPQPWLRDAFRR